MMAYILLPNKIHDQYMLEYAAGVYQKQRKIHLLCAHEK